MTIAHVASEERRAHQRHRVLKPVKAVFNVNQSVLDCVMRDVSIGGARLHCAQPMQLPEQFQLIFVAEREMRDVRVAWRKHDQLGVVFLSPLRKALHLLF
jgi:hypothetical protein